MIKIVGYARESTMDQAHNGFNMADQVRRITNFCQREYGDQEYSLEIRREEGCSGKDLDRPEIQKILEQADRHEIDIVAVYCLDRLTRSLKDLNELLNRFDTCSVSLVCITNNIDTSTPIGRFFVNIIVLIAQWELDTLKHRSLRGIEESARQGNYSKGSVPLGYRRIKEDTEHLEIIPEEAEVVRYIFNEIAADRESNYTIAKKLREKNVLGRRWVESTVRAMIQNRLYYGCFEFLGVTHPEYIEPIVSKDIWDRANEVNANKKYDRHPYLYRDKVWCAACRKPMSQVSTLKKKTNRVYLYYKCPECGRTVNEKALSDMIHDQLNELARASYCSDELNSLKARYSCITSDLNRLLYDSIYHDVDQEYAAKESRRLQSEQTGLKEQITSIAAETEKQFFACLEDQRQQELLKDYVERIEMTFIGRHADVIYNGAFNQMIERR